MATTKDKLKDEAMTIQKFLEEYVSEDSNQIEARGHVISVYMSRTGKMLADAKYFFDQEMKMHLENYKDEPPSVRKELAAADCYETRYLVNWIERINKTCAHQLDLLRSVLSKQKEEMRLASFMQ